MTKLAARLGAWDAALLTAGSIIGTGIFLSAGDVARAGLTPGFILGAWALAGLVTLAGALSYAELGTMYPRAGGMVHFLEQAYGPLPAFLYAWTCLAVIMSGGIAAIAMGFGEYVAVFVPVDARVSALAAIALLTAVNHFGVRGGATVQNVLAVIRIGSIAALVGFGLWAGAPPRAAVTLSGAPSLGLALIPALWTYDGWYAATFSAGELKNPKRDLPLGMISGIVLVVLLYLAINVVYLRALPVAELAQSTRPALDAAQALFGAGAARLFSAAVLVSAFGCLAATILYSSRTYIPMAEQGLFFRSFALVHERWRTPVRSLWLQSAWAALLVLSGTYEQLYTYVTFAVVLFHAATGAALFVLRVRQPLLERPVRAWGYPVVPALFVLASLWLAAVSIAEKPRESLAGLGLIALGLPAWLFWRRRAAGRT